MTVALAAVFLPKRASSVELASNFQFGTTGSTIPTSIPNKFPRGCPHTHAHRHAKETTSTQHTRGGTSPPLVILGREYSRPRRLRSGAQLLRGFAPRSRARPRYARRAARGGLRTELSLWCSRVRSSLRSGSRPRLRLSRARRALRALRSRVRSSLRSGSRPLSSSPSFVGSGLLVARGRPTAAIIPFVGLCGGWLRALLRRARPRSPGAGGCRPPAPPASSPTPSLPSAAYGRVGWVVALVGATHLQYRARMFVPSLRLRRKDARTNARARVAWRLRWLGLRPALYPPLACAVPLPSRPLRPKGRRGERFSPKGSSFFVGWRTELARKIRGGLRLKCT